MDELQTKKWFESEVARYGALLVFFLPIVWFIFGIKTDIALIQQSIGNINQNHEAHIQDILGQIKDLKEEQINQQNEIIDLQKQVLVIIQKK